MNLSYHNSSYSLGDQHLAGLFKIILWLVFMPTVFSTQTYIIILLRIQATFCHRTTCVSSVLNIFKFKDQHKEDCCQVINTKNLNYMMGRISFCLSFFYMLLSLWFCNNYLSFKVTYINNLLWHY